MDTGTGLAGYNILRDGDIIATVGPEEKEFEDSTINCDGTEYDYQIQPFDSLFNEQTEGGIAMDCSCSVEQPIEIRTEPAYTIGNSNQVCFKVSWPLDFIKFHLIRGESPACDSTDSIEIDATEDTLYHGVFLNLRHGSQYCYQVQGFDLQQRLIFSETVFSTQDTLPPEVSGVEIPEITATFEETGWVNETNITVEANIRDPAGIWKAYLYRRSAGETDWGAPADSIIFCDESGLTEAGFVCDSEVQANFTQTLPDGDYEFRLEAVDATHTPESCYPAFVLAGNGGTPAEDAPVHVSVRIDTTPPAPVELTCVQDSNVVRLSWTKSNDGDGVGLQGYEIFRNDTAIAQVPAPDTSYVDSVKVDSIATLVYQIQPFDSLGNQQEEGGFSSCDVVPPVMVAIDDEFKFTRGLSLEVTWSVSQGIADSFVVFQDLDCDASVDSSIRLPDDALSHVFDNLHAGRQYCYWVSATDAQARTHTSEVVMSIPDTSLPLLDKFDMPDVVPNSAGKVWVFDREILLHFAARDTGGEVWAYQIFEQTNNGELANDIIGFPDSSEVVVVDVPYKIQGESNTPFTLSARVFDGARREGVMHGSGLPSNTVTLPFEIIFQDTVDSRKLFAFPNPFNPLQHQNLFIRQSDQQATTVAIYDFFGNLVRRLTMADKTNDFDFVWDGRNENGQMVANGGYFCLVKNGSGTHTFRIAILKK